MNKYCNILLLVALAGHVMKLSSQGCNNLNIQLQADIPSVCSTMVMTMIHDAQDRPYLYVANKEAGLKIFDISNLTSPSLTSTVPISSLASLHVMNLSQSGNYLYLAIGNSFTNPQQGGMAIIDITNPSMPKVTDLYIVPASNSGAGIVKVEGNFAYLGAMGSGLVILNVTDKNDIVLSSQFKPDINYPVKNPNSNLYNARGMEVKNSIVYLCYDAGGFRIINCTNKLQPFETGRYANPALHTPFNLPRAYNNIMLDDTLVYIAVDYCGMEVLNIKDTSKIKLQGWWNPDHCPGNNWFTSPVHANEIQFDKNSKIVFISTGKSDMMVVDVSNPSSPDSCNMYGGIANNIGTWGAGLYKNQIYLSYICTVGIPFTSNWTGVKILNYNRQNSTEQLERNSFSIFPNPAGDFLTLLFDKRTPDTRINIYDMNGKRMFAYSLEDEHQLIVNTSNYPDGLYYLLSEGDMNHFNIKFSVQH